MLGARIDVIQPQIRNLIAYLLPLPDKIPTTAVVKRDKTSGLDRNHRQKCLRLQCTLLIRKGSIKYCLLLLWARLKISYASHDCVLYEIMKYMCVKQQTDNLKSFVIVYILLWLIVAGGWMVTEGGDWGRHMFTEVTRTREKAQLLYASCVHFTVDWLFWNLYGSYIAPRPQLSWKKRGNFTFDNMVPLRRF